jgi:hypothetical protein
VFWWVEQFLRVVILYASTLEIFLYFFFLFRVVLGFKLSVSHLLVQCFTAWCMPPVLFALVTSEIGSSFLPSPARTVSLLFYASHCSWDDRCIPPLPTIDWDGFSLTFCLGWPWISILQISASQAARIIRVSPAEVFLYHDLNVPYAYNKPSCIANYLWQTDFISSCHFTIFQTFQLLYNLGRFWFMNLQSTHSVMNKSIPLKYVAFLISDQLYIKVYSLIKVRFLS